MGCAGKVTAPPPKPIVPPPPIGSVVLDSGWYLKNYSISGSLVTLNALKQTSAGGLKSNITTTASNAELIQSLLNSNSKDALNYAVTGLLGAGVEWELDVENQRISYTDTL